MMEVELALTLIRLDVTGLLVLGNGSAMISLFASNCTRLHGSLGLLICLSAAGVDNEVSFYKITCYFVISI